MLIKADKDCKVHKKVLGGHTGEMLQLVKSLNPSHYYPRTYIVANTDILSKEKAVEYEQTTGQQVGCAFT